MNIRDLGVDVGEDGGKGVAVTASNERGLRVERGGCRCEPSEGSGGGEEDGL